MNPNRLAGLLAVSAAVSCATVAPGLGAAGPCRHVGGGILTNFLDPSQCMPTSGSSVGLCTDGPATGDLKGAVGVAVLKINGSVLHNRHHWVTDTSMPGFFVGDYLNGIYITDGTGAFEGATGKISAFGAVDQNKGQVTLRYEGTVCLEPVPPS